MNDDKTTAIQVLSKSTFPNVQALATLATSNPGTCYPELFAAGYKLTKPETEDAITLLLTSGLRELVVNSCLYVTSEFYYVVINNLTNISKNDYWVLLRYIDSDDVRLAILSHLTYPDDLPMIAALIKRMKDKTKLPAQYTASQNDIIQAAMREFIKTQEKGGKWQ